MGDTLVGIKPCYTHGRHPGGYISLIHPWEAPWWVLISHHPMGGTLVGIDLPHPMGGTLVGIVHSLLPCEAPWWV